MQKINVFRRYLITFYISIFIVLCFIFLATSYIIPRQFEIPILVLIGFAIIIVGYFIFINLNHSKENREIFKFKILSENSIKIILILLMMVTFFIPSADLYKTIIDWNHIGIFNVIKATIFLIGSLFLPGASIYHIFLPNSTLHKKFKVEPFFLKIIIYPLLSFTFLGTLTIILDRLELIREYFASVLFIAIIVLTFYDLLIEKIRRNTINIKSAEISISKYTLFILLISLGVLFISIGIQLSVKYLRTGDSWAGITMAKYIGSPDTSPFDQHYTYTHYWGYISFALSVLCGIPYININVMLASFMYLSITSIYLLTKAILYDFKSSYAVLSTLFICTFSSLFYIIDKNSGLITFEWSNISMLIYDLIFIFRYKTYAHLLTIVSLAVLIIILQTNRKRNSSIKHLFKSEEFKFLILAAIFLIQGYIVYFYPVLIVLPLIFIFCLLSDNKKMNLKFFTFFVFLMYIFFLFFDFLMIFIPSNKPLGYITSLLGLEFLIWEGIEVALLRALMVYLILGCFLVFNIIFYYFYSKFSSKIKYVKYNKNIKIFIFFLIIFSLLLIIELFNIFIGLEQNFFIFYLDITFLKIGCIGILGLYLSYFCYQTNKRLFFVLITWIFFSFIVASILIFFNWYHYIFTPPQAIPSDNYYNMVYWYNRFWFYSIIPLSILASIGLIKFSQKIKNKKLIRNKNLKIILKHFFVTILIFLSVSNSILVGMWAYHSSGLDDDGAHITGWVSEYIPAGSNILIDEYFFSRTLKYMADVNCFFAQNIYEEAMEEDFWWDTEWTMDPNCNISLINELDNHHKVLKFNDHNNTGNAHSRTILDFPQSNGTIDFYIRTTNKSKTFLFYFQSYSTILINFQIRDNAFYYYDGNYKMVCEIQNDIWYQIKIEFECLNTNYKGLNQYKWNLYVNNNKYNNLNFQTEGDELTSFYLITNTNFSEYSVFIDDFSFSWAPYYIMEMFIPSPNDDMEMFIQSEIVIAYLKQKNIRYLIYTEEETYYKSRLPPFFINNELIPKFFTQKLYEYGDNKVYFAPEL